MRRLGYLTRLTWEDVTGRPTSLDRLRQIAGQLPTETVLALAGASSIVLLNRSQDADRRRQAQVSAVEEFLTPAHAASGRDLILRGERDAFLDHEQLLAAARLAIIDGLPGPPQPLTEEGTALVAELFLGINDVLNLDPSGTMSADELLISLGLRSLAARDPQASHNSVARSYDLLVTRSRSYVGEEPGLDLDAAFDAASGGMSIDAYYGCAIWYLAPFIGVENIGQLAGNLWRVLAEHEEQISDLTIRSRCQTLFTANLTELRDRLGPTVDLARASTLAFRAAPIVRLEGGRLLPISASLIFEKLSLGAYWLLHEYFRAADRGGGAQRFTKFIGKLHEAYVSDLLSRTYAEAYAGPARFVSEADVIAASGRRKGQKPPFDAALVEGDSLVLFEVGTPWFTIATIETADVAGFHSEVKKVSKKAKQLASAIDALARGRWTIPGLDLASVRHIFPVLVMLHPYPRVPSSLQPIRAEVEEALIPFGRAVAATRVHKLELLSDEELEALEPYLTPKDLALPVLLTEKLEVRETADTSMKTYLLNIREMAERENPHMKSLYEEAGRAANQAVNQSGGQR